MRTTHTIDPKICIKPFQQHMLHDGKHNLWLKMPGAVCMNTTYTCMSTEITSSTQATSCMKAASRAPAAARNSATYEEVPLITTARPDTVTSTTSSSNTACANIPHKKRVRPKGKKKREQKGNEAGKNLMQGHQSCTLNTHQLAALHTWHTA